MKINIEKYSTQLLDNTPVYVSYISDYNINEFIGIVKGDIIEYFLKKIDGNWYNIKDYSYDSINSLTPTEIIPIEITIKLLK